MKYYRKTVPQTPVNLPRKRAIKFESFDGIHGYYKTDDDGLQSEFANLMKIGACGLTELSETAFEAEFGKKKANSTPLNSDLPPGVLPREEIGSTNLQDTMIRAQSKPKTPIQDQPRDETVAEVKVDETKPITGTRRRRKGRPPKEQAVVETMDVPIGVVDNQESD